MVLRARAAASPQRAKYCGCSGTSARLLYCRARVSFSATFILGLTSLLSPQTHGFLRRPVGEREEHAFSLRIDVERHPRRHDERVARLEIEPLAADLNAACAFDHRLPRAVRRPPPLPPPSPRH